jgi:hypothetical protein
MRPGAESDKTPVKTAQGVGVLRGEMSSEASALHALYPAPIYERAVSLRFRD